MTWIFNFYKHHKVPLLVSLISCALYLAFAYELIRTDFTKLLFLYFTLFGFTYFLLKTSGFHFKFLVIASILFRVCFLFAVPNLSQDFYRFIWDGRMAIEGFNPYLYTPDSFIQKGEFPVNQAQELYHGMGELSASHFTNYPPLNQLCFFIAALFSNKSILGSIIVMRLIIIAADLGILYFGKKLLEALKLPIKNIFWYILNPFIIIELIGNLHFEGVMIFFLIWSLYLLYSGKWRWAAVILACSVSVKLIPLMFMPLFLGWFFYKKNVSLQKKIKEITVFFGIVAATITVFFLPFLSSDFIKNYAKTTGLWFNNFEFNASIYYIVRQLGFAITGYNEIGLIGKVLPILSVFIILGLSFFRKNNTIPKLAISMLLALSCYLFLSTTVHPWYIATLIVLCLFTKYKFPLVWSFVIVLSYLAYSQSDFKENLWIIALEYFIVFSAFVWEVVLKKRLPFV